MLRGQIAELRRAETLGRDAKLGLAALLAFAAIVLVTTSSASADTWGVPLSRKSVKAQIGDAADVDSYLVEAPAGARLDVKIGVRGSALTPAAELIGPDGPLPEAAFEASSKGLRLRNGVIPASGRYEVRVSSADGSDGAYSISAKVRGTVGLNAKQQTVANGEPTSFPFAAAGGATISFSVKGRQGLPTFVRITAPSGATVPIPDGAVRGTLRKLVGSKIRLPAEQPFGEWQLVVESPGAAISGLKVRVRVRGGGLTAFKGALPVLEPRIIRVDPTEAGFGTPVRVTVQGLIETKRRAPRLFVGGLEVLDAEFLDDELSGTLPHGLAGLVDVGVLNGDGHALVVHDALTAVPPPRPASISPVIGPAGGGTLVEVRGSGFRDGAAVTVAGISFPDSTQVVDDGLILFTTPAFAGGPQTIGVRDITGQTGAVASTFEFVAAPSITEIAPPLIARLPDELVSVLGGGLRDTQSVLVAGGPPSTTDWESQSRVNLTVPLLPFGPHELTITDEYAQVAQRVDAIHVFDFETGPAIDAVDGGAPSDIALADYDLDGDLDAFVVSAGGTALSSTSHLRILRNDGTHFTDVTVSVAPTIVGDDWRADSIAVADIAGDIGTPPPDGYPDLVLATRDDNLLASDRSRIRILANRSSFGDQRAFVDRTDVLMPPVDTHDNWRAADIWLGDLDGDGGPTDIVATYDETLTGESPLTPFYAYYLSGSRVFQLDTNAGGYGRFAWQPDRFPKIIGTRVLTTGFRQCAANECARDYVPFAGSSLAVADFDGDGRRDVAVTSPAAVVLTGGTIASTMVGQNTSVAGKASFVDRTSDVSPSIDPMRGDIVLAGDVSGTTDPDLVVVRRGVETTGMSIVVAEFRGFGSTWRVRTDVLLPGRDGDEALQADAAALHDVDGDGDLDLVLVTSTAPTTASSATGRGLRVLRNLGAAGFSRELESLLPAAGGGEDWSGVAFAIGDLDLAISLDDGDGDLGIVIVRPNGPGTAAEVRSVRRTTAE